MLSGSPPPWRAGVALAAGGGSAATVFHGRPDASKASASTTGTPTAAERRNHLLTTVRLLRRSPLPSIVTDRQFHRTRLTFPLRRRRAENTPRRGGGTEQARPPPDCH